CGVLGRQARDASPEAAAEARTLLLLAGHDLGEARGLGVLGGPLGPSLGLGVGGAPPTAAPARPPPDPKGFAEPGARAGAPAPRRSEPAACGQYLLRAAPAGFLYPAAFRCERISVVDARPGPGNEVRA